MARKQIVSSRKSWSAQALKLLAFLIVVAAADRAGLWLWMMDRSLQRIGEYSYHATNEVQVRVSPRICRFFARVPTGVPMQAITLGRTIFVPGETALPLTSRRLRHELSHVRQWQRRGLLGFSLSYSFWQMARGYEGNPLEREARAAVFH